MNLATPAPEAPSTPSVSDYELQVVVARELQPGERLLWCGRPNPARRFWATGSYAFPVFLPVALAALGCLLSALFLRESADASEFGNVAMAVAGSGMLALGIWGLLEPSRARKKARETCYLLTERRIIITGWGAVEPRTLESVDLADVEVYAALDGGGPLRFYTRAGWNTLDFHDVADPLAVRAMVREAFPHLPK